VRGDADPEETKMRTRREPPKVTKFAPGSQVTATFHTTAGTIVCRLFADDCPMTVGNFVGLATGETPWTEPHGETARRPLYDGTIFHRVIPKFMIQGGDPLGNGTGGPGYRFADEIVASRRHDKPGVLSMAKGRSSSSPK
jgi:peptidyl-prolyl cis-trans isomerase A (cyclophilin A)